MGSDVENIPFHVVVVIREVNAPRDNNLRFFFRVGFGVDDCSVAQVLKIQFVAMIGPGADLQEAFLDVKGEVLDVYWAVTLVDGWRFPDYFAIAVYYCFCFQGYLKITVSTGIKKGTDIDILK